MARLFIAIGLPSKIKSKIAKEYPVFEKAVEGNWVKQDNIHITLKFLGGVSAAKTISIKEKLSKIRFEGFVCELKGVGAFPSIKHPRVLWAGVSGGDEKINILFEKIDSALSQLGFPKEKRFHTHATFCRVKRIANKEKLAKLFNECKSKDFGKFKVDSFLLIQSKLSRGGSNYSVLEEFKF